MAQLKLFPEDCRALVVDREPLQAFAIELLLNRFGCRHMGPAERYKEIEELLTKRRPSFALVDAELDRELQPVTELLDEHDVPFAFLAIGAANQVLDQHPGLIDRPRIQRPYHSPTLHAAACNLYADSLARKIVKVDRLITEGQARLARQIALIEQLAAAGCGTSTADALARECGRALKAMRTGEAPPSVGRKPSSEQADPARGRRRSSGIRRWPQQAARTGAQIPAQPGADAHRRQFEFSDNRCRQQKPDAKRHEGKARPSRC